MKRKTLTWRRRVGKGPFTITSLTLAWCNRSMKVDVAASVLEKLHLRLTVSFMEPFVRAIGLEE